MQELEEEIAATIITKPAGASSYLFTTRRPSSGTLAGGGFWSATDVKSQPGDSEDPAAATLFAKPAAGQLQSGSSTEVNLPPRKFRASSGAASRYVAIGQSSS